MIQSGENIKKYNNSLECYKYIVSNEGYRGFFKGSLANFYRGIAVSMSLIIYDEFQNMVGVDLSI